MNSEISSKTIIIDEKIITDNAKNLKLEKTSFKISII
jgi:hypothetical protein